MDSQEYLPFPALRPLVDILNEWNTDEAILHSNHFVKITEILQPDVPTIPGIHEGTLERFNFSNDTQRALAEKFRLHEVGKPTL